MLGVLVHSRLQRLPAHSPWTTLSQQYRDFHGDFHAASSYSRHWTLRQTMTLKSEHKGCAFIFELELTRLSLGMICSFPPLFARFDGRRRKSNVQH
jgi:hypothetical protein